MQFSSMSIIARSPPVWSGKSAEVMIAFTPVNCSALEVSIFRILACACGERKTNPISWPGIDASAPYRARPVTLSTPSGRGTRVPITLNFFSTNFGFMESSDIFSLSFLLQPLGRRVQFCHSQCSGRDYPQAQNESLLRTDQDFHAVMLAPQSRNLGYRLHIAGPHGQ